MIAIRFEPKANTHIQPKANVTFKFRSMTKRTNRFRTNVQIAIRFGPKVKIVIKGKYLHILDAIRFTPKAMIAIRFEH